MRRGYGIPPAVGRDRQRTSPGATISEAAKIEMIKKGEIKRDDLSVKEREIYREHLDPLKRGRD